MSTTRNIPGTIHIRFAYYDSTHKYHEFFPGDPVKLTAEEFHSMAPGSFTPDGGQKKAEKLAALGESETTTTMHHVEKPSVDTEDEDKPSKRATKKEA